MVRLFLFGVVLFLVFLVRIVRGNPMVQVHVFFYFFLGLKLSPALLISFDLNLADMINAFSNNTPEVKVMVSPHEMLFHLSSPREHFFAS